MTSAVPRGRSALLLTAAVACLVAAGCSSDERTAVEDGARPTDTSGATAVADLTGRAEVTVRIMGNHFQPSELLVSPGTVVHFEGNAGHDVVFDDATAPITSGAFAAAPDQQRRFTEVGAHPFHCTLHGLPGKGMHGTVTVAAEG